MKVLLLSPLPPPVGGIASWTVNILDFYSKNHDDLELIHFNSAIKSRDVTRLDIFSRVKSGIKDNMKSFPVFVSYLKKNNPDVIHMTSSASIGLAKDLMVILVASLYNIPVVTHFRFGRIPELFKLNNWEWKLIEKVSKLSSSVIVLDYNSKSILEYAGIINVHCIPNPISKKVEQTTITNLNNKVFENKLFSNIIFVGHITKNKGVFDLIDACVTISKDVGKIIFIGPCEKNTRNDLLHKSKKNNINIEFTGVLNKDAVLEYMRVASVLVLPSYSEGFPNVIIEAMAMGCPIIATNVGAIPDMLDINSEYPSGIVVEPKDIISLADSIRIILTDKHLANTFSRNALLKVKEKYTLSKVTMEYEEIWKSLTLN